MLGKMVATNIKLSFMCLPSASNKFRPVVQRRRPWFGVPLVNVVENHGDRDSLCQISVVNKMQNLCSCSSNSGRRFKKVKKDVAISEIDPLETQLVTTWLWTFWQAIDRNRKAIENRIRYFQKEEAVQSSWWVAFPEDSWELVYIYLHLVYVKCYIIDGSYEFHDCAFFLVSLLQFTLNRKDVQHHSVKPFFVAGFL